MTVLSIIGVVLAVLLVAALFFCIYYLSSKAEARVRQQAYQAQLRAFQVQQQEYETEQRIRQATRTAMDQMVAEARSRGPIDWPPTYPPTYLPTDPSDA